MPRQRANERACDTAIRKTLAYRAVFHYPLSYHQLCNTLISQKQFSKGFFDKELQKMVVKGYIGYRDGKYFDKRIKPVSWEFRYKNAKQALDKVQKVAEVLSLIPWIKLLCVTGSTAAYNVDKDSDIDIFIVAKTHRLWLTRGFVAAMLKAMGLYIRKDADPGKWCPNLFIDEVGLTWPETERSVFTAHEIVMMQPIINRDNTYFKFLKANSWIKNYFPHFNLDTNFDSHKDRAGSRLVNFLEKMVMLLQTLYMKRKRTTEIIGKHIIHFRKNDNTRWILDSYKKLI